jgi:iron-sulfur cluster repair protein YtfE (RIC family)
MHFFSSYKPVKVDLELLKRAVGKTLLERAPSPITVMTVLQHRSILWQLDRLVQLADVLALAKAGTREGDLKRRVSTQMQSLWKGYGCLLELMQEHAQMEERVVFPSLEVAAEGVSEAVLGDHARDLPVMNGIHADMKGVMVMEQGSSDHLEALLALALRLHTLQAYSVEHYHEEERELLPMLQGAGIASKQQRELVAESLAVMEASHAHLLPFLFQGLCPHEIHQYLSMMQSSSEQKNELFARVLQVMNLANEEFEAVKDIVQERVAALATIA